MDPSEWDPTGGTGRTPTVSDARKLIRKDPDLSGLTTNLYDMVAETYEETLIRRLFEEIRRLTPTEEEREELRPKFYEDPEEVDLAEESRRHRVMEEYPGGGCHRLDAEMRTASVDLLVDAMETVHREGFDPEDGWEFWLHAKHLDPLREDYDHFARLDPDDGLGVDAIAIHGIPVRGFGTFPPGAILLWDPEEAVDSVHTVGQRQPEAFAITRPRYVCRVTSVGYDQ